MKEKLEAFGRVIETLNTLREQCPWDKKQTFESLRPLTIEETYELADAIIAMDPQEIKKELGDVLLHIVFYSRIGEENGWFGLEEVCNQLVEKLVRRHPHIYGNVQAETEEQVKQNWEKIKLGEGKESVLSGVPRSLPSMIKAIRLQEKARLVGFDWDHKGQVMDKIREEIGEFEELVKRNANTEELEEEYGDLLFSIINYARFLDINPDNALERTNLKFISRFRYLEKKVSDEGKNLKEMTLEEMDRYWNEAKRS